MLEKEALNGDTNEAKNGVESNYNVHNTNGHTNGNGTEAKKEVAILNGNGFTYNEYDGKA